MTELCSRASLTQKRFLLPHFKLILYFFGTTEHGRLMLFTIHYVIVDIVIYKK